MKLKKVDPAERPDDDNPELTRAELRKARPARDMLPELIGTKAAKELLRRGPGRPPKEDRKVNQTLRIDPDVLEAYRREGRGWQTRINQILRDNMPRHQK
ncbi:MAG TPA: BrnA antitoxin family protein [Acetobacteraceae bacterium]|nr:BrnA antitoxin family protein [Acetobacteraceae bacterium]